METNPNPINTPPPAFQPAAVPAGLPARIVGLKPIAWAIFLGGVFAALQGLAILILSTSYNVTSGATGMMIVKWVFAAFLFLIARDLFQAIHGLIRGRTRIMAGVIGAILLLLLVLKYGEMLSQVRSLKYTPISFFLKIPDYGFLVVFPFTVFACLAVPFVLKKGTASPS